MRKEIKADLIKGLVMFFGALLFVLVSVYLASLIDGNSAEIFIIEKTSRSDCLEDETRGAIMAGYLTEDEAVEWCNGFGVGQGRIIEQLGIPDCPDGWQPVWLGTGVSGEDRYKCTK